jgi:hypothetical protein
VSYGLGMGVVFTKVAEDQKARLERWLANRDQEF